MKVLFFALLFSFAAATTLADEGMWQPHQLKDLRQQLKAKGLKLDPRKMQDLNQFPMNAIISLGGCTASFVSQQGLVLTNHHCAYGSIQFNSTANNNLLRKGFVAKTQSQELQATPGSRVYVTESLKEVTAEVLHGINSTLSGKAYYDAVEKNQKQLIAACENSKDYRCEVYSYHGGSAYYLSRQLAIRDLRLVYAPPSSIGKFGGNTDNWMWPRHTGDWAFYRAYVSPEGRPADYSPNNQPYTPKAFLKLNAQSVADGDFVMVLGYPGSTNRHRTAAEVENTFEWSYPTAKRYREEYIEVIETVAAKDPEAGIKYQSTIAGLANYAKNYGSMINSYAKGNLLSRKREMQQAMQTWVEASPTTKTEYAQSISRLEELIAKNNQYRERDLLLAYLGRNSMFKVSRDLYRLAMEKRKANAERDPGFQERDMLRFKNALQRVNQRYDATVDKAVILHFLKHYAQLPASQRLASLDKFFSLQNGFKEAALSQQLDTMHATTQLNQESQRLAWMEKSPQDFRSSQDPYIQFAVAMYDTDQALRDQSKDIEGEFLSARPAYMAALLAYKKSIGETIYADANSSLRISYGNVSGYSPQDGLYAMPFTSLEGVLAKYVPGGEFDVPALQRRLIKERQYGAYYDKKLSTVPVNFLSTLDITGGNSGSPALNGKGELVGLLFDGVYESIIGDWDYNPELNRAIAVSSSYMLWVMQYIDGAENLIEEMSVKY